MRSPKILHSLLLVTAFLFLFQGMSFLARLLWADSGICNNAGPFSLSLAPFFLGSVTVLVLSTLILFWWKNNNQPHAFVWLIIIAAGISNALERLQYGCVFDFISFSWWPVFNIADVALSVSVVFLMWKEYRSWE